jgi:hypothetical protein
MPPFEAPDGLPVDPSVLCYSGVTLALCKPPECLCSPLWVPILNTLAVTVCLSPVEDFLEPFRMIASLRIMFLATSFLASSPRADDNASTSRGVILGGVANFSFFRVTFKLSSPLAAAAAAALLHYTVIQAFLGRN